MATIINKTLQGISWNFKSQLISQVINFVVAFLLMRWLSPDDFGKFAMVFVVFSFLQIFRDVGFTVAIIQKKESSQSSLATAFWVQIFLSLTIAIPLLFLGGYFNSFYEETGLDQISFWLCIDFFIGAFGLVPIALLRKELKFKTLFQIQILATVLSSFCGIYMALEGMGYLSLIGKMVSYTLIVSIGSLILVGWRPHVHLSKKELKELLRLGLPDTGNHVLSYLVRNTDDFFIGRVIGATSLGFYNRAYVIMLLPMVNLTSVLKNVLFSTWSKMQDETEKVKNMFIKVSGMISLVAFPIMTLLAVLAEPIIVIVFGEKWLSMATTLSILSVVGMFQSVTSLIGIIFIVFDKNELMFKINIITSLMTIGLVIWSIYTYESIEITALVYGVTSIVLLYPSYYFAGKIMETSFLELVSPMFFPIVFSLIISLTGWYLFDAFPHDSIFLKLSFSIFLSIFLYIVCCYFFKITPFMDLLNSFKHFRNIN